jgi:hypothetical protein
MSLIQHSIFQGTWVGYFVGLVVISGPIVNCQKASMNCSFIKVIWRITINNTNARVISLW